MDRFDQTFLLHGFSYHSFCFSSVCNIVDMARRGHCCIFHFYFLCNFLHTTHRLYAKFCVFPPICMVVLDLARA